MYRILIIGFLLSVSTNFIYADPTRPSDLIVQTGTGERVSQQSPTLEAIIKKGDTRIAVIDGRLTTEAFTSSNLRVKRIFVDKVEVEYPLNGDWIHATLTLTAASFSKKPITKMNEK